MQLGYDRNADAWVPYTRRRTIERYALEPVVVPAWNDSPLDAAILQDADDDYTAWKATLPMHDGAYV